MVLARGRRDFNIIQDQILAIGNNAELIIANLRKLKFYSSYQYHEFLSARKYTLALNS